MTDLYLERQYTGVVQAVQSHPLWTEYFMPI